MTDQPIEHTRGLIIECTDQSKWIFYSVTRELKPRIMIAIEATNAKIARLEAERDRYKTALAKCKEQRNNFIPDSSCRTPEQIKERIAAHDYELSKILTIPDARKLVSDIDALMPTTSGETKEQG